MENAKIGNILADTMEISQEQLQKIFGLIAEPLPACNSFGFKLIVNDCLKGNQCVFLAHGKIIGVLA